MQEAPQNFTCLGTPMCTDMDQRSQQTKEWYCLAVSPGEGLQSQIPLLRATVSDSLIEHKPRE